MTLSVHTRGILQLFVLSILAAAAAGCAASPEVEADLVLRGGKVVTVDEDIPDGQAIAVKGDTILAVGSNRQIRAYIGPNTEVIDLDGALVIPGFIESHGHFLGVGDANMQLDLMSVANWSEIVSMVGALVGDAPAGELIRGRGWHQEKWDEVPEGAVLGLPTHHSLSAVSPDNPVVLGTPAVTRRSPMPRPWRCRASPGAPPTPPAARSCGTPTAIPSARSGKRPRGC